MLRQTLKVRLTKTTATIKHVSTASILSNINNTWRTYFFNCKKMLLKMGPACALRNYGKHTAIWITLGVHIDTLAEDIKISVRRLQRSEGDVSDPIKYTPIPGFASKIRSKKYDANWNDAKWIRIFYSKPCKVRRWVPGLQKYYFLKRKSSKVIIKKKPK